MFKLYNDDCRNILQELIQKKIKVDLIVTSPPYDDLRNYKNTLDWNMNIFQEISNLLYQVLKDGGVIVWVVNDKTQKGSKTLTSFKQAIYFKEELGFNIHDVMIYAKKNPIPQIYHKRYTDSFEYMFILSKGTPKTHNPIMVPCKYKGYVSNNGYKKISTDKIERRKYDKPVKDNKIKENIWYYTNTGTNYGHPAIFPLELAKDHILSWSNPNDLVLDCFMGSGTVGVACQELNRNFIGIEKVTEYYEIARKRINTEQTRLI